MGGGAWLIAMLHAGRCCVRDASRVCGACSGARRFDLDALAQALGTRGDRGASQASWWRAMCEEGPEREADIAIGESRRGDRRARAIALVDEIVGDLRASSTGGRDSPSGRARICIAGSLAMLFFALADGRGGGCARPARRCRRLRWRGAVRGWRCAWSPVARSTERPPGPSSGSTLGWSGCSKRPCTTRPRAARGERQ